MLSMVSTDLSRNTHRDALRCVAYFNKEIAKRSRYTLSDRSLCVAEMISILSRLICPVARCIKYRSHLRVFRNREYHLRIAMRNYTVSASYEIENDNI